MTALSATNTSSSIFVDFRGISRLGSASMFSRWFKLAHTCIQATFYSRSSRDYCDNATKVICVANVIFGQERLTEQFLSMRFFCDSAILFTKWCSSPSEHFAFNTLFLWEHSLCAPEGAERWWAASGENRWNGQTWRDPLWSLKQKMVLTLRPPPQVHCNPSSAQNIVIIKPV